MSISYAFIIGSILLLSKGISVIQTVGFCLFFAIGTILPVDRLLMFISMLEPVSTIYRFNGRYTIMPFLFILLLIKLFLTQRTISKKLVIPIVGMLSISAFNYLTRGFHMSSYAIFFIPLICFLWLSEYNGIDKQKVFDKTVWLYVLSVLIESIASKTMPTLVRMLDAEGYRLAGFSTTWNYGRHLVVAIAFLAYWLRFKKKNICLACTLVIFFLKCMIDTGLYSGLIALVGLMLIVPFTFQGTIKQRITYIAIALAICMIGFVFIYIYIYLPMFSLRGQVSDNGRFEIWGRYCDIFLNDLSIQLFGIGAGANLEYAASLSIMTAHNIVIEKMLELGYIGMILLIYLIRECYRRSGMWVRKNMRLFPLIAFIGTSITQGVSGNELIFILMMLSI